MDVTAVVPVSLERVQAVTLNDAAREGRILEAKVTAMLSNTLARLAIGDASLDVATPRPLPVGAMLTLKAEREGGQLKLITQGPIREPQAPAGEAGGRAQALPAVMLEPVKAVLARVQALAVEAMLAEAPTGEVVQPQSPFSSAPATAQTLATPLPAAGGQPVPADDAAPGQPAPATPQQGSAQPAQTPTGTPAQPLPGLPQPSAGAASPSPAPLSAPLPSQPQAGLTTSQPGTPPLATPSPTASAATPRPETSPLAMMAAQGQAETEVLAKIAASPTPPPPPNAEKPAAGPPAGAPPHREAGIQPQSMGATPQQAAALAPVLAGQAFEEAIVAGDAAPQAATDPASEEQARPSAPAPGATQPPRHETGISPNIAAAAAQALREAPAEARDARAAGTALGDTIAVYAAADPGAAAARSERAATLVIQLPLHFPGNPNPLRLEVERDEGEPEPEDGGEPRPPSWTIRFAAEAGNLGMVHAAITYVNEQVGVRLWAERGDTAALFQQAAPHLQDALAASDVKVETLTIAEGRPAERPRAGDAAPPSAERRI